MFSKRVLQLASKSAIARIAIRQPLPFTALNRFGSAIPTGSHPFGKQFVIVDPQESKQKLIERQRQFDSNPTNAEFAYKYFRELNRQQKFHTVKRLYEKYETDYRISSINSDFELQDKVREQYTYACSNLEQLTFISEKTGDDTYSEPKEKKNLLVNYVMSRIPEMLFKVFLFSGGIYIFTYILESAAKRLGED